MLLYHGAAAETEYPEIARGSRLLDYGAGFYTYTDPAQAKLQAKTESNRCGGSGTVSVYSLDIEQLSVSIYHLFEDTDDWLDFLCSCRGGHRRVQEYDVISAPALTDKGYTALQLYELGVLDKSETLKRLLGSCAGDVVVLCSEAALRRCIFEESFPIEDKGGFQTIFLFLTAEIVNRICRVYHYDSDSAFDKLQETRFYSLLKQEKLKLWQFSAERLFEIYQQEIEYGKTET